MLKPDPITLLVDTQEITATRGAASFRTPTTLDFVEMSKSGWLFPTPAHLKALLPGESPPRGTTTERVSLFPATADAKDRSRHLAAAFNAIALKFLEGRFFKVKPTFVVTIVPALQQHLGGHGKAVITAALAPISLGTTFVDP